MKIVTGNELLRLPKHTIYKIDSPITKVYEWRIMGELEDSEFFDSNKVDNCIFLTDETMISLHGIYSEAKYVVMEKKDIENMIKLLQQSLEEAY